MTHTQPDQLQFDGPGMPQVTPVLETPAAAIVVEINPKTDIDLMIRVANKGLMVMWINHRLIDRAENHVERSIVFYDEAKTFVEAVPSRLFPRPGKIRDDALARIAATTSVRYWSKGV